MKKRCLKINVFAVILSLLLVLPGNILISAAAVSPTTKVKHKPPKKDYIPGFRINLSAEIKDKAGILVTRCYFKTKKDENFGFVNMFHGKGPDYRATLPAPWLNSEAVEYVFVVVNKKKQVTRTQVFVIEEAETKEAKTWKEAGDIKEIRLDKVQEAVEDYKFIKQQLKEKYLKKLPKYQSSVSNDPIAVKTDLDTAQVDLFGFNDIATLVEVPEGLKYGFLAKEIYSPAQVAAAGGTTAVSNSTGAVTAGTIAATGGVSAGAIIGTAVGIAALGGGAAALSSTSSSKPTPTPTPIPTPPPINVSATIEWGDFGVGSTVADDAFQLWFAGRFLGTSPVGGKSGKVKVSGLLVGTHPVVIRFITPNAGQGSFGIELSGGARFGDGSTSKSGLLPLGGTRTFVAVVPQP